MATIDWNEQARKAADFVSCRFHEAHRGAIVWHGPSSTTLAFDCRSDPQKVLPVLQATFMDLNIPVRAVAIADEDTLVVLLETEDYENVTDILWEAFWEAEGLDADADTPEVRAAFEGIQRETANQRLTRFLTETENWWDKEQQ